MKKIKSIVIILLISLLFIPSVNASCEKASDTLKKLIVQTNDGLYADPVEVNRYVYRGENINNYIKFNGELWRIMAIEPDNTLKIIKNKSIGKMAFDDSSNTEYWDGSGGNYNCYHRPCFVWGNASTTLDSSGFPDPSYNFPTIEATLNTYLNTTYYDSLNEDKKYIDKHLFNVGLLTANMGSQTLAVDVSQEQSYKWLGNIGLINPTDYIRASKAPGCTDVSSVYGYPSNSCRKGNYLFSGDWTYEPLSQGYTSPGVWTMPQTATSAVPYSWLIVEPEAYITMYQVNYEQEIVPVLYLKSDIILSGEGTQTNPYIIGQCSADKDENNQEEINVPPTSAYIPLIISSIAILLIALGFGGYYFVNRKKHN